MDLETTPDTGGFAHLNTYARVKLDPTFIPILSEAGRTNRDFHEVNGHTAVGIPSALTSGRSLRPLRA